MNFQHMCGACSSWLLHQLAATGHQSSTLKLNRSELRAIPASPFSMAATEGAYSLSNLVELRLVGGYFHELGCSSAERWKALPCQRACDTEC